MSALTELMEQVDNELRLKYKKWMAVVASNAGIKFEPGQMDSLVDKALKSPELQQIFQFDPNDPRIIQQFKQVVAWGRRTRRMR